MSNNHLFSNRRRNGQLARKATTATPLEVQTRILQVVLRYINKHDLMILDQGRDWIIVDCPAGEPILLIEVATFYGDPDAQSVLVRTTFTRRQLSSAVTKDVSVQTSGERSATQRIFNVLHEVTKRTALQ